MSLPAEFSPTTYPLCTATMAHTHADSGVSCADPTRTFRSPADESNFATTYVVPSATTTAAAAPLFPVHAIDSKVKEHPPTSHVLFDMDGLLLDTEIVYTRATQKIVSRYGKVFDWSLKSNMIGRPSIDSAHYLIDALALPISAEDYLLERDLLMRQTFPFCQPLPGAKNLVQHLSTHAVPIAVATSSSRDLYEIKTQNHSWFSLFNAVVTGDEPEVKRGKPAPDIFLCAAERIGALPETTLVFEDAPSGLTAAKAAGMRAVVVPDANMDKGRYAEADLIISSLREFSPEEFGLPDFVEYQ